MTHWILPLLLIFLMLSGCSDRATTLYNANCGGCHDTGRANTPRYSNTTYWAECRSKPYKLLLEHSIDGFTGRYGIHPPRGGNPALTDEEVRLTLDVMLEYSKQEF